MAPKNRLADRRRPIAGIVPARPALSLALHNAQDNLLALQRLAEQTAALHRQFLEGQEKTQQIFLKLLEQQQRLSLAVLDPAGACRMRRSDRPPIRHDEVAIEFRGIDSASNGPPARSRRRRITRTAKCPARPRPLRHRRLRAQPSGLQRSSRPANRRPRS